MRKSKIITTDKDRTLTMNHRVHMFRILPLLVILLAAFTIAVNAQQSEDESPVAMVIRINGSLEYRATAADDWQPAKTKQALYNGNQVRTALGNRAIIVYTSSGTRVLVNENTELEISAQVPAGKFKKPTSERTRLMIGQVYSRIKEKKEPGYVYEVETPSSVASVRGTEFDSKYQAGTATFLSMLNVIEVMNQLGTVLLNQYQQTTVQSGQAPADPTTLSRSAAQSQTKWTQEVEPIWKLNIIPQGGTNQAIGEAFSLTIWAENLETGSIDANASFSLSAFTASSNVLEFSTDNGRTWGGPPTVTISNGQAVLMARGSTEGTVTLTAEAADSEPASATISVSTPKERKSLELRFTDPDGSNEKTLILELEEK